MVGINTAVSRISFDQGNQGIGFAISSALARRVVEQLIKSGKVIRGYLGVAPGSISADQAKQLHLAEGKGAIIGFVLPGSPAEKAGVKVNDVVTSIDDKPVADSSSLRNLTFTLEPGTEVPLNIVRDGRKMTLRVAIAEMPSDQILAFFGFSVRDSGGDPQSGVIVDRVVPGSPAEKAGFKPGLRIVAIGNRRVFSKAEFDVLLTQSGRLSGIPFGVIRDGRLEVIQLGSPSPDQP